ncbi:MAG TPA: M14 family zinc carboxypeptidase [bacterium]|nr:M14 family zinc carboxypeptidase [bacterium]HPO51661.1 M14 family zinc carboxypeptidase [bacterium]
MKKIILFLLLSWLFVFSAIADSAIDYFNVMGEVYFRFENARVFNMNEISTVVSISHVKDQWIYAYANQKEFARFLSLNIPFEMLQHPGYAANVDSALKFSLTFTLSQYYPTYPEYLAMMQQFASDYPDICSVYDIGTSVQGRKILAVRITGLSDSLFKPKVFLTSTIHGNELTGYAVLLYLIDYLVSEYGRNPVVTEILDRCEIWINPLANPDGTYWAGDDNVFGARRYNANSIDLNRNFPDPAEGNHPDGNEYQSETISMMNVASTEKFVLSANFHSGAELVNYPWDTWEKLHPDNNWFVFISRQYADTVHLYSPDTYFDDLDNGITNGYAWYRITGGRQDYMNYFKHCREVTIELSEEFLPFNPSSYWEYHKDALIGLIAQSLTGICGTILCETGIPLPAKIEIPGHDADNSFVLSETQTGRFFRLLLPGNYNLRFSADYHYPQEIENIQVSKDNLTQINVVLKHAEKADPSADHMIDIVDVILCLKMAIGLQQIDLASCDMNDDGFIDISDVILMLRASIGL